MASNFEAPLRDFGAYHGYIAYEFVNSKLIIYDSPFDKGGIQNVTFSKGNSFVIGNLVTRKYTVKKIDEENLILSTQNELRKNTDYYFKNQDKQLEELSNSNRVINNGQVVIEQLKVPKGSGLSESLMEYNFNKNLHEISPSPRFNGSFGYYILGKFDFPKGYEYDTTSQELIIEFTLRSDKKIEDIKIIKGIDEEINNSITKIISKTSKKWSPLKINDKPISSMLRYSFVFIRKEVKY